MYKRIEEMHKEYVEWALGLLKTRFDLKPEFYDEHHHDNFTYECGAESLWVKIESAMKELLWLRERQIPEGELVADRNCNEDYEWEDVQVYGQIFIECVVDEICKEIKEGNV